MPKRGLIVLVLTWIVLLFLPAFRGQLSRNNQDETGEQKWYWSVLTGAELKSLLREHPRDGALNLESLRVRVNKDKPLYWQQFDALVARLPDDLLLRRAKMIDVTRASLPLPFFQPYYGANASQFPTQKDRDRSLKYQSRAQRETLVEQAREGARQAPADGFFAWMEAMALWNREDEPALRALERAGQSSDFEDGTQAYQLALLRWKQTQGEVAWDERLVYLYGALLPHYANMRQLQREVVWSGIAHYKRGDKAGAYRRWRIALEASSAMRRAQLTNRHSFYIGLKVGEALQSSVWDEVARALGGSKEKDSDAKKLAAFVALARRDGQSELANYCLRERADFQTEKIFPGDAFFALNQQAYRNAMGFNRADTRLQLQLPWLSRNVFWLSIAGALALLLYFVGRAIERLFHREFIGRVSVGQIAFFGALWLGFLGLAAKTRLGTSLSVLIDEDASRPALNSHNFFDNRWLFWAAIAATLMLSITFCYGQRALETRRLREQTLRRSAHPDTRSVWPWIFGIWSVAMAACIAWMFPTSGADRLWLELVWLCLTTLTLGLAIWNVERRASTSDRKLRPRLGVTSAFAAAICCGFALHFGAQGYWITDVFIVSGALWSVGIWLYLAATDKSWRPLFSRALAVALQTLGGVAALCALALLIASLAALPVRARQNRIVDDYIQRGEIDWMRSQMQTQRASQSAEPNSS